MSADVAAVLADSPWAGRAGLRWRPGVAAVASPMCQAVDWANFVVSAEGAPDGLFLKVLHPDMAGFVDVQAAHAGACAGAAAGVAPAVEWFLPGRSAIAFALWGVPWRGARLDDLRRPEVLQAAIAAKAAVRRGPAMARAWDVFARVRGHAAVARAAGVALPGDVEALLAAVGEVGAALEAAGRDDAPCHNDGQASNVLLGPGGAVLLVDFDCAGQADPHYDLAVLLNEAHDTEAGWQAGVEMAEGRRDARVMDRCRAYAVADDLMWGLQGLVLSALSPRREVEFLKYGEWRLLRCRMALRAPGFAARLHRL
ncbi:MAG: phosphotransferase family protein [Janthinobacterium lividum]